MDFGETLIAMTGIILTFGTIMLIVLAIGVRIAFKPAIEAWASAKRDPLGAESQKLLEKRIDLLEEQVRILERDQGRILEEAEFNLKLRG